MTQDNREETRKRRLEIKEMIRSREYTKQEDILNDLLSRGYDVSLSTLSRDLVKIHAKSQGKGEPYVLTDEDIQARRKEILQKLVEQEVRDVHDELTFLGISTRDHSGPAVASAIELVNYEGLLCAIPTDKAVLVVFQNQSVSKNQTGRERLLNDFENWGKKPSMA